MQFPVYVTTQQAICLYLQLALAMGMMLSLFGGAALAGWIVCLLIDKIARHFRVFDTLIRFAWGRARYKGQSPTELLAVNDELERRARGMHGDLCQARWRAERLRGHLERMLAIIDRLSEPMTDDEVDFISAAEDTLKSIKKGGDDAESAEGVD